MEGGGQRGGQGTRRGKERAGAEGRAGGCNRGGGGRACASTQPRGCRPPSGRAPARNCLVAAALCACAHGHSACQAGTAASQPGTLTRDQDVDLAVGGGPDLRAGRLVVHLASRTGRPPDGVWRGGVRRSGVATGASRGIADLPPTHPCLDLTCAGVRHVHRGMRATHSCVLLLATQPSACSLRPRNQSTSSTVPPAHSPPPPRAPCSLAPPMAVPAPYPPHPHLGVVWVLELLQHEAVGGGGQQLLRLAHGALRAHIVQRGGRGMHRLPSPCRARTSVRMRASEGAVWPSHTRTHAAAACTRQGNAPLHGGARRWRRAEPSVPSTQNPYPRTLMRFAGWAQAPCPFPASKPP